jgi:hypothetical protein
MAAVSRGYYAAFHVARQFMEDLGFLIPRGDQAHAYLWFGCPIVPIPSFNSPVRI